MPSAPPSIRRPTTSRPPASARRARPRGRRCATLALALLLGSGAPPAIPAAEVAGVKLPDAVDVDGTRLVLNGAGVRTRFFVRIYVGALYLPRPARAEAEALDLAGPKRVAMHFLYRKVEAGKLREAWRDGIAANNDEATAAAVAQRLERFNALFPDLVEGDVVILDLLPGTGTRVSINGTVAGVVPGDDFARALLRVWLGPEPPNAGLKRDMLGE